MADGWSWVLARHNKTEVREREREREREVWVQEACATKDIGA